MTEDTGPATPAEPDNATQLDTTFHDSMPGSEVNLLREVVDGVVGEDPAQP